MNVNLKPKLNYTKFEAKLKCQKQTEKLLNWRENWGWFQLISGGKPLYIQVLLQMPFYEERNIEQERICFWANWMWNWGQKFETQPQQHSKPSTSSFMCILLPCHLINKLIKTTANHPLLAHQWSTSTKLLQHTFWHSSSSLFNTKSSSSLFVTKSSFYHLN